MKGSYIFINNPGEVKGNFKDYVLSDPLYMHEYAHYIDSQNVGPSYLTQIGIPSAISADKSKQISGEPKGVSTHDMYWTETRANRLAAKYFERYGVDWNRPYRYGTIETYYPTINR